MTTQYTPILKLALPVTGELSGTWGDVVNDNITSMVEQAIAGLATISTWTGNSHTLTTANGTTSESRCAMLVAQNGAGLTAAGEIVCPASSKLYVLKNDTSYTITLKTAAGTGVAVVSGNTAFLFCDGTNVNACVTTIVDGRVTGNLTVDGNATVNGNTTLGNATSDTITATARFASDLVPSADNTRDLGSTANSWKDLYIDGTAYLALVDINGGTIDGVSIGASTAATIINVDNLRLDGNTISSTDTNGNVVIAPNGTGDVQLDADTVRVGDSGAAATLTSNGAGALTVTTGGAADLTLSTNSGTTSGTIVIANGAGGNITLTPEGTGDVILSADRVQIGDANTDTTLTTNGTGSLNLTTNNGTNSGTIQIAQGANGNITLTPNGTGSVSVPKLVWSNGTATRVPYLTTGGQFTDSANLTFDGTTLTVAGLNNTGNTTLGNASGDTVTVTGTITSNLIFTDNTYDIGASGATRPRNLYLAGDATIGGSIAATTLDLTNLEVTNIKAKDGTASMSIADSTGVVTVVKDQVVNGITVGRGAGAVSTNTAVGASALAANTTGANNVAIGNQAGATITTGSRLTALGSRAGYVSTADNNTFVGHAAGENNTTGANNAFFGQASANSNTTGSNNTVVGKDALLSNTTASNNTAVGYQAGYSNTTGSNNNFSGFQSGFWNTTGSQNTAFGVGSYASATTTATGSNNSSFGYQALYSNTTASNNTAVGYQAGYSNTTGAGITALGYQALRANTTSGYSTAVGYNALTANTTGNGEALGVNALSANTTGTANVGIGANALVNNTTGANSVAVGNSALYSNNASNNTAVGFQAGYSNTTYSPVNAFGQRAAYSNTSGTYIDAFGSTSLESNTTGSQNVGFGTQTLRYNTTGSYNSAVGTAALYYNTTGQFNTALGNVAMLNSTTGNYNTAVGYQALYNNTIASYSTAVGYQAGVNANRTSDGSAFNTFIGYQAGLNVSTGQVSIFIGSRTGSVGSSRITGNANTVIGDFAGNYLEGSASNNSFVGQNSGAVVTNGVNNTFIGQNSGGAVTTGSKNTILGAYTGNQGGLDIRTSSNNIVLSDGDGNPKLICNTAGNWGVYTVPSTWFTSGILEGPSFAISQVAGVDQTAWTTGVYQPTYVGTWKHKGGYLGARYEQTGSSHAFYTDNSASTGAGTDVTWAKVLDVATARSLALEGASTQAGTGITFPATQSASSNANTLDDYEEGTWTPTYVNGVTSPNYQDVFGYYTKIGRFVQVVIRMQLSSGTANASQVQIGGLPFAASSGGGSQGAFTLGYQDNWLATGFTMLGLSSSTQIDFYKPNGGNLLGTEVTDIKKTLHITGTYFV